MRKAIWCLTGCLLTAGLWAQPADRLAGQTHALTRHMEQLAANMRVQPRTVDMTAQAAWEQVLATGQANGCQLAAMVADKAYMRQVAFSFQQGGEEKNAFLSALPYAAVEGTGCGIYLMRQVQEFLERTTYDISSEDFALDELYYQAGVMMGRHPQLHERMYDWAFKQVAQAARRSDEAIGGVWGVLLLNAWAEEGALRGGLYGLAGAERKNFEAQVEALIERFDWLKDENAEYLARLGKIKSGKVWHKTNQAVMLSIFAQANSFFSMKDNISMSEDTPVLVRGVAQLAVWMVQTGGFNAVGRALSGKGEDARLFDDRELFYFHHPTPGTDGNGHYAPSASGRKHLIVTQLIRALLTSYTLPWKQAQASFDAPRVEPARAQASEKIMRFVRHYLEQKTLPRPDYAPEETSDLTINTDDVDLALMQSYENKEFKHYLFVPLRAMSLGKRMLWASSTEGWDKEEQALQRELYMNLKKVNYGAYADMANLQGLLEVAMEWEVVGEAFKWIGKGAQATWKAAVPLRAREMIGNGWRKYRGAIIAGGVAASVPSSSRQEIEAPVPEENMLTVLSSLDFLEGYE